VLFNSYKFIFIFLPIVWCIYFYLNKKKFVKAAEGFLVFSSLVFYSCWKLIYLPLILTSVLFNYTIGNLLSDETRKNKSFSKLHILIIGVILNISLLGYFKYYDFFISNLNTVFNTNIELLNLVLPLAISFFTFQQIAFLVDTYKHKEREYDFLKYTFFVTFFPQLIAGPIVQHRQLIPQLSYLKTKIVNFDNISKGLYIFSIGLFKKVVIADTFAIWATNGFDVASSLNLYEAWATSLSYTFQLYFDFSGYSDMAIGLAFLFNLKLPINFNSPYKAMNIQDFWRRWHITLSHFLRDYIYIPLGGNKNSEFKTFSNIMTTFIIGGIWHGAGWTFIFWGFLHGVALILNRLFKTHIQIKLPNWLRWFITFNFINVTWIYFRASSWTDATKVMSSMFSLDKVILPIGFSSKLAFLSDYGVTFDRVASNIRGSGETTTMIIFGFILVLCFKNSFEKTINLKLNYKTALFTAFVISSGIIYTSSVSEFLYFNF
jgi:alginate O-acetyltransferase complex protein AlgI